MARHILLAGAALIAGATFASQALGGEPKRTWTLGDQLSIPEVRALAIAADGHSATYVVRIADREHDRTVAILRQVDLKDGTTRELLRAAWIDQLSRIPGTADWSARIDRGDGVQLYRIAASGSVEPLVVHPATAMFGDSEGAVFPGYGHAPLRTGVRAHSWSPDGRRLFYVVVDAVPNDRAIRYDGAVTAERARRRAPGNATASIYLRGPDEKDILLGARPQSDLTTFFDRNHVRWEKDEVRYDVMEVGPDGQQKVVTMAWAFAERKARLLDPKVERVYWLLPGPNGGKLSSQGNGDARELVETLPDGKTISYGQFAFAVGDGRAVGGFRSQDGTRSIAGTRTIDDPRFGLTVVEKGAARTMRLRAVSRSRRLHRAGASNAADGGHGRCEERAGPAGRASIAIA